MPVDYSKFDNIEDSDEEREKAAAVTRQTGQAVKPWEAPFQPPTRALAEQKKKKVSASGREILDGGSLNEKLQFVEGVDTDDRPNPNSYDAQLAKMAAQLGLAPPPEADEASAGKPTEPKKTCVRSDGRKKVHTTNPDGSELVEEFDERTDVLLLRKSRKPSTLGKEGEWTIEVGQAQEKVFDPHSDTMRVSSSNPIFLRKDTPECFQWRVRNLAFPADVYSITVDHEKQQIVVRTSNKKYFKRIDVEDLSRLGLKLKDESLSWKHQHNTLIISYTRPIEVVKAEQAALKLVANSAMNI